jgi:hypothetical protein
MEEQDIEIPLTATATPNYNYKKVWKYLRMFNKAKDVSEEYLRHQIPNEYNLTEEEETNLTQEEKKKFIIPTTLSIPTPTPQGSYAPPQPPELYILMMEHDVQLRERNGFMNELTKYVSKQNPAYQQMFGEHTTSYAKNRLLNTLAEHEQWKAHQASTLYIELEDYLKAYIATQIVFGNDGDNFDTGI